MLIEPFRHEAMDFIDKPSQFPDENRSDRFVKSADEIAIIRRARTDAAWALGGSGSCGCVAYAQIPAEALSISSII